MSKELIERGEVVKICYDNLKNFIDIFPMEKSAEGTRWENPIPDNVELTIFCKGLNYEGFIIKTKSDEIGLEALIAKKWILHSELEKLAGRFLQ